MPSKSGRWKILLAFLAMTAFAVVAGHESTHLYHKSECKICQVKQVTPSDTAAVCVTITLVALAFFLMLIPLDRPADSIRRLLSDRAPPAPLF